MTEDISDIFK